MTPYRKRLTPAIQRMAEDMLIRNLAVRTIDSYTYHVDRFAKHFGKLPEDLGPEEIREFQLWMIQVKQCSWSSFNQAVCGLRFLYTFTLPRPWVVQMIPFGNRPKRLPVVLGQEEVRRLIECVTHAKHRAVLLTLYAAGVRLSEATHLTLPRRRLGSGCSCGSCRPRDTRIVTSRSRRDCWPNCERTGRSLARVTISFQARRPTCRCRVPRSRRPASWQRPRPRSRSR